MIYRSLERVDKENKILEKYFLDEKNINRLEKMFQYRFRTNSNFAILEYELDLLENEIQLFIKKQDFTGKNKIILDNFKKFLPRLLNVDTMYLYSPLFNDSACLDLLFSNMDREIIRVKKNAIHNKVEQTLQKFLNGEDISNEDKDNLFIHLSSDYYNYRVNKEVLKQVVDRLLDKKHKNSYYEIRFLMYFIDKKQSFDHNYEPSKIYVDRVIPILEGDAVRGKPYPSVTNGGAVHEGIIAINTLAWAPFGYPDANSEISIVSHESWHKKQYDDLYSRRYTCENYAKVVDLLLFYNWEFYRTNYDFLEFEYQPNFIANKTCLSLFKGKEDMANSRRHLKELGWTYSYRMVVPDINSVNSGAVPYDEYVIEELGKKIEEDPKIYGLDILQLFFHKDGKVKNIDELVDSYYSLKKEEEDFDYSCDCEDLFAPYFDYVIKKDNIGEEFLSSDRMQPIVNFMAQYEAQEIRKMIEGYDWFHENEKTHLIHLNMNFGGMQDYLIKERYSKFQKLIGCVKSEKERVKITKMVEPFTSKLEEIISKDNVK